MKSLTFYALMMLCVLPSIMVGQGQTAVPFLQIVPSAQANGMGGAAVAHISNDPGVTTINPAQVGLGSLRTHIAGTTYTPRTAWLPAFQVPDLSYGISSTEAGVALHQFFNLPFRVGIGAGYSRIRLNLGTFAVTSPQSPELAGSFEAYETANIYSVGLGFESIVRASIGWNFKRIESAIGGYIENNVPIRPIAKAQATDFGALIEIPLVTLASRLRDADYSFLNGVQPIIDLTLGYTRANIGDDIVYQTPMGPQADPLPWKAAVGVNLELGLQRSYAWGEWTIFTYNVAREAEDILVDAIITVDQYGGQHIRRYYQQGLGDIHFFKDAILGKHNGMVGLRKGWEVNAGEVLQVRGGSFEGPGSLAYHTSGFGVSLRGMMNFLSAASSELAESPIVSFVRNHVDLRYDRSFFGSDSSPIANTVFHTTTVIFR